MIANKGAVAHLLFGIPFAVAFAGCSSHAGNGDPVPAPASDLAQATADSLRMTTHPPRNIVEVPQRRRRFPSPELPDASSGCGAPLSYLGGPVLQNPKVYAVYWTSAVDPNVVANIGQFYTDVLASSYWDLLSEYQTAGVTPTDFGASTNQGLSRGTFGGAYTITPTTTTCTGSYPCVLDDSQIQAELAAQIAAGTLPAVTTGCDGQVSSLYMFEFPENVTISLTFGGYTATSCTEFCGYHLWTSIGGQAVPYGVIPNLESGPCASICTLSPSGATFDDVTSVHSHELAEASTDTEVTVNASEQYTRPSGWGSVGCGEVGDECSFQETSIMIGADTWTVQRLWSNALGGCAVAGVPKPVCTGPGVPAGCRACTCADDQFGGPAANGCDGATPWCETSPSSVNLGNCVACTTSSECSAYQVCAQTSTASTDDVCVACGGVGQPCCTGGTCTAPDTCGGGGTANVCGCTPLTACPPADDCGTIADGCGGTVACVPGCTAPQTCAGGGTANVCGCTPATSCPVGDQCGTAADGCGGTVACGSCGVGQTCAGNSCVGAGTDAGPGDSGSGGDTGAGDASADAQPGDSGDAGSSPDAFLPDTGGAHGEGGSEDSGFADSGGRHEKDGGTAGDAARGEHDGGEDAGSPNGQTGGCSCRAAGTKDSPSGSPLWAGTLALLALVRVRRGRRGGRRYVDGGEPFVSLDPQLGQDTASRM